jgi:hypothetical protein
VFGVSKRIVDANFDVELKEMEVEVMEFNEAQIFCRITKSLINDISGILIEKVIDSKIQLR